MPCSAVADLGLHCLHRSVWPHTEAINVVLPVWLSSLPSMQGRNFSRKHSKTVFLFFSLTHPLTFHAGCQTG